MRKKACVIASGFCEAISARGWGDCFVAKSAPRNDVRKKACVIASGFCEAISEAIIGSGSV
jgi:hypothetical protein